MRILLVLAATGSREYKNSKRFCCYSSSLVWCFREWVRTPCPSLVSGERGCQWVAEMNEDSGEFSEGLDEFENSIDETRQKSLKNQTTYSNKPYDEAFEVSQDLSMAESFDGRDKVYFIGLMEASIWCFIAIVVDFVAE